MSIKSAAVLAKPAGVDQYAESIGGSIGSSSVHEWVVDPGEVFRIPPHAQLRWTVPVEVVSAARAGPARLYGTLESLCGDTPKTRLWRGRLRAEPNEVTIR
jgi:hypothetical protein